MVRTRVGYAGGTTENPTYHDLGDHTETVEIDYDPAIITYDDLLAAFWEGHSPNRPPVSRQYASIIFYHNEEQRERAIASRTAEAERMNMRLHTEIVPAGRFYRAEDYHQKYELRRYRELFREYEEIYPDPEDLVDSTAAARVNGYAGGYGTAEQLEEEIELLGLSPGGQEVLRRLVRR